MAQPIFTGEGPQYYAAAYRVYRPYAKPGPYQTKLSPQQEMAFRQWIAQNRVPFNPNAKVSDYDMRGYWKAMQAGKAPAWQGGATHFTDTFKTPYDTTFSRQSMYSTALNPYDWRGNELVHMLTGRPIFVPPVPPRIPRVR